MTTAREIVATLGGTWSGNSGIAHCPAHDDQNPSLSVTQDGDRVLVNCFAGCNQDAVVSALRGKGITLSSGKSRSAVAYNDQASDTQWKDGSDTLGTAIWLRRNANFKERKSVTRYLRERGISGKLPNHIGQVSAQQAKELGYSKKVPAMFVPIIDSQSLDEWEDRSKLIGCQLTLLKRLTNREIVRDERRNFGKMGGGVVQFGGKPRDLLLVAEGVETALSVYEAIDEPTWAALSASNMSAITIPAQVGAVVVCADNDEAGRKAGQALAERVAGLGKIAMLAIPGGEGDDWNDVLVTHGDEHCREAILAAPKVEAPKTPRVRIISGGDLLIKDFPPRRNILSPWLPWQGLAMIHAPRGTGKTWVAFGVMCAVAAGGEFLGWRAEAAADVLYLDGELPGNLLQQRYGEFQRTFGSAIDERVSFVTPDLQDAGMPDLATLSGQAQIDELITPSTGLIIIDSKATLCRTGVENDAESWRPVQSWLLKHRAAGKSILLIHHSGKSGLQRGSSAIEDVLDAVIGLRRPDDYSAANGAEFNVAFEKNRHFFGSDAEPFRAKIEVENGGVTWTVDDIKSTGPLDEVAELLNNGMKQKDIADQLNITPGRVSQLAKEARQEGLVDDKAA